MRDSKISKGLDFIEKNSFFILIIGIMLGGVCVGTFAFCNMSDSVSKSILFLSENFIEKRASEDYFPVILEGFCSSTIQLVIIFLLGFSCISQPLTMIFPFAKGLGLGVMLSQIYSSVGYKGFLVIIFLIIPFTLLTVFAFALAIQSSLSMSNHLAKITFNSSAIPVQKGETALYFKKFLILEAIMVFASIIDALFTFVFSRFLL